MFICNMTKGTKQNPGRDVKQKSGPNRAVLGQPWGLLAALTGCLMVYTWASRRRGFFVSGHD
ncbi:MAG: hypothetical protein F4Y82_06145 [Cenarchaeum sp. SB0665_bin_23]|nr:hypothetical protein [Cenarchaeum sp. SB0665_bin_23]MYB47199.1 hypothetical protein [Cenarchaeum sp. SB0662_bin_33]